MVEGVVIGLCEGVLTEPVMRLEEGSIETNCALLALFFIVLLDRDELGNGMSGRL